MRSTGFNNKLVRAGQSQVSRSTNFGYGGSKQKDASNTSLQNGKRNDALRQSLPTVINSNSRTKQYDDKNNTQNSAYNSQLYINENSKEY